MTIIERILKAKEGVTTRLKNSPEKAERSQIRTLKKLLHTARNTHFGNTFKFDEILLNDNIYEFFKKTVPISDYSVMYPYWQRAYQGEEDVCWPGKTEYFAVSSGTSEGASKYIPITKDILKSINKAGIKQIWAIANTDLPKDYLTKNYLAVGGSTDLQFDGTSYSGDLSGITTQNMPVWFERFSKPSINVRREENWEIKINKIIDEAKNYDVAIIAGVPAWIKILLEGIIERYQLNNIHEIWPHLSVYLHGGVAVEPYKRGLNKLFDKEIMYFDTYLASEGFLAYQSKISSEGMRLIFKNGMFYEFIPFNSDNFTSEGVLKPNAETYDIINVDPEKEYAILISTNAGAWRYLIGDTIKFTNYKNSEIVITGRTKHFLSLCGEHLSVDNMVKGLEMVSEQFGCSFEEFTVKGVPYKGLFAHQWYVACNNAGISEELLAEKLDDALKFLNDDYKTERDHALRGMFVKLLPKSTFFGWMEKNNKMGAQSKFPRVLTDDLYHDWLEYIG